MIGVWAGIAVLLGVALGPAGWWVLPLLAGTAWLTLRGSLPIGRRRALVIAVLVGIAAVATVRSATVLPVPTLVSLAGADRFEGRVVSPVQTDLRYQRFDLDLSRARIDGAWVDARGTVRVMAPASSPLGFGDRVGLTGSLDPAEDTEAGYRSYLEHRRLSGSVFSRSVWVERPGNGLRRDFFGFGSRLADTLRRAVPGDSGILLGGLVVGDDSALSDETASAFRTTGMSHITAVSGSNLALIVVMLMAVGGPVAPRGRVAWLILVMVMIWLYAVVTGLEPPVIRAALMATIALAARPFGRRPDYLTAAALSAALMALVHPELIWDIGFQLSLSASVALAALASGAVIGTPGGAMRLAIDGAIMAQLATLPVTAVAFGTLSPASILTNIVVGPLVGIAFPVAFAGVLLAIHVPAVGNAVIACAGWLGDAILSLIGLLAQAPYASVPLPHLGTTGRLGLLAFSAPMILLLSRDGRRWLGRTVVLKRPPTELARQERASLTAEPTEGIVPPGPHSLAAQDVTLSR